LRYVLPDSCTIRERFLSFEVATDLTGAGLSSQLLQLLVKCGIDDQNLVGQSYDWAAAMSGGQNGVQKHIRDTFSAAVYVHCAAHCLNLCLMKAAQVPEIRVAVTLLQDIAVFFSESNKRLLDLQLCIREKFPEANQTRLKKYCTTRWVEKQEAVMTFEALFSAVVESLAHIVTWHGDCRGKAAVYLKALDGSFMVALEILCTVLEVSNSPFTCTVLVLAVMTIYFLLSRVSMSRCLVASCAQSSVYIKLFTALLTVCDKGFRLRPNGRIYVKLR